jgi:hypothetical protein
MDIKRAVGILWEQEARGKAVDVPPAPYRQHYIL